MRKIIKRKDLSKQIFRNSYNSLLLRYIITETYFLHFINAADG